MTNHGMNPIGDHPLFKKLMTQSEKDRLVSIAATL